MNNPPRLRIPPTISHSSRTPKKGRLMTQRTRTVRRREFLKAAAATVACPYLISSSALGQAGRPPASERITVGAIGIGFRAHLLLEQLPAGGQIVALCDCNLPRAETFKAAKKANWKIYQHYQELLDRKDIDAVIVATGEFQRVLPCIHACQAGKDVYAEKPLTLYIHEGRVLVDAVRKHDRIFQVGTQQRSMAMNRVACELVRSGGLGKVQGSAGSELPRLRSLAPAALSRRGGAGRVGLGRVAQPGGRRAVQRAVDGLAALARLHRRRDRPTGAPMASTRSSGPWASTAPARSRCGRAAAARSKCATPTACPCTSCSTTAPRAARSSSANKESWRSIATSSPRTRRASPRSCSRKSTKRTRRRSGATSTALWQARWHLQNWLDCIRSRQKPVADVEIGHRSISVSHLATITRRLQRRLHWDPAQEQFVGDEEANRLVDLPRRQGYELPKAG